MKKSDYNNLLNKDKDLSFFKNKELENLKKKIDEIDNILNNKSKEKLNNKQDISKIGPKSSDCRISSESSKIYFLKNSSKDKIPLNSVRQTDIINEFIEEFKKNNENDQENISKFSEIQNLNSLDCSK